jgi:hypothetical protein
MILSFRQKSEAKSLPEEAQRYLRRRFMLQREYINDLRCFESDGFFREQPVKKLLVFSPVLARKSHLAIRTGTDLEQHPEVMAFEGRMDDDGEVYFYDRRSPK